MPTNDTDYGYYIKLKKIVNLFNQSLWCPLVINTLGSRHTHTHSDFLNKRSFKKTGACWTVSICLVKTHHFKIQKDTNQVCHTSCITRIICQPYVWRFAIKTLLVGFYISIFEYCMGGNPCLQSKRHALKQIQHTNAYITATVNDLLHTYITITVVHVHVHIITYVFG